MNAAEAVGRTLYARGVRDAFGVIGSGNFVTTQSLHAAGARFHHARHEGGAICMADGYARVSGRVGVCTVHQGPGFTNALTGLTEAAKSRTPLLLVCGEAPAAALRSNFRVDQAGVAATLGAIPERIHSGASAAADTARALRRAHLERRPVVLNMPLDVQGEEAPAGEPPRRARGGPRARAVTGRRGRDRRADRRRPRGRSSSPAAAPCWPARASRWRRSATRSARCSPRRPWATGCSPARRGRSGSPAASPRRPRRG